MQPDAQSGKLLDWLYARQRFGLHPGLERTAALLSSLGEPQQEFDSILVAGTNGKGSTVATLASALLADGRSVAGFISPHLMRIEERIVLNGEPVALPLLIEQLGSLRIAAERSGATFFEILFAAACRLMADAGIEIAAIEVGLGGRYDATNTLSPLLSIITTVDLDHVAVLGSTVERIAADKAGILRSGRPALTGATGAALGEIEAQAATLQAPLSVLGRDFVVTGVSRGLQGSDLVVDLGDRTLEITTPLPGQHQLGNVALAAVAADLLGVSTAALRRGTATTLWPGRFELLDWSGRRLIVDGAHNPAAARALARTLTEVIRRPRVLVLGMSHDKDIEGVMAELAGVVDHVVATRATYSGRGVEAQALAERIGASDWHPEPARALDLAAAAAPEATLVVAGSLFLVGEVRSLALGIDPEPYDRWQ